MTAALSSAGSRFFGKGATSINPGLVAALIIVFVFLSFYSPFFLSTLLFVFSLKIGFEILFQFGIGRIGLTRRTS